MEFLPLVKTEFLIDCTSSGPLKSPLLFDTLLGMHNLQMGFWLVINVIHAEGDRMIESGIEVLSKGYYLGVNIRIKWYLYIYPIAHRIHGEIIYIIGLDKVLEGCKPK